MDIVYIVAPVDSPIYTAYTRGISSGRISGEVFWRRGGSSFAVEYNSTPIRKAEGVVGAVVTFNDITQRMEMEAALKRFSKLAVGREQTMIGLKREINAMLEEAGPGTKYQIVTDETDHLRRKSL